jgi:Na+-translocating ferredoxin:NAD+ oxidoreductase RnfA subunit
MLNDREKELARRGLLAKNENARKLRLATGELTMNHKAFIQTMIALASAALGLVAALAWNEAIKATLAYLNLGDSLAGLYTYAIVATIIAIVVLVWLGKLAGRIGGEAAIEREAEG